MFPFLGASPDGYNSAHLIGAGGQRWLILTLDWRISEAGFTWARGVLAGHPTVPGIVTTHDLAYPDYTGTAALFTNGRRLWDGLIRDHEQIFLSRDGHHWPPARTVLANAAGHDVHVYLTNYQDGYYGGGAAMIRFYTFDLIRNEINVSTFAPWFQAGPPCRPGIGGRRAHRPRRPVHHGDRLHRRFAGLDPATARAPPSPIRDDRFRYGRLLAVRRVRSAARRRRRGPDQTGRGNDLVVRRFSGSGPDVMTLSPDHHHAQPAHASIRFDGGRDRPRRRAADRASECFLQYLVHPAGVDVALTSWSNALSLGRRAHLAVVNDGRRTIWVDGSPIVRNPRHPASPRWAGRSSSAPPLLIWLYGQSFYGWIGDVRTTGRALPPNEFLLPLPVD